MPEGREGMGRGGEKERGIMRGREGEKQRERERERGMIGREGDGEGYGWERERYHRCQHGLRKMRESV